MQFKHTGSKNNKYKNVLHALEYISKPHVINFVNSFLYRVLTDYSVQFKFCLCFLYFVNYVVDPLQNHLSSYSMTLAFRRSQLIDLMDIIPHQLVKSLSVYPLKFIAELYSLSIFSVAKLILPLAKLCTRSKVRDNLQAYSGIFDVFSGSELPNTKSSGMKHAYQASSSMGLYKSLHAVQNFMLI